MSVYNDLLAEAQPGGKLEKLEKIDSESVEKIKELHPNIPVDFLSFLSELGSGELGQSSYVIYNGVLEPNEIYDDETADDLSGILIFGDDMQGYCSGFDMERNWVIVEIDPTDMSFEQTHKSFEEFIRNKILEI